MIFSSFSDLNTNMITTLNQMDDLANQKISELAIQNVDQLQAEILKGQNTLIGARKKTYFRTLFGTLLYDLSVLFGVGILLTQLFFHIRLCRKLDELNMHSFFLAW